MWNSPVEIAMVFGVALLVFGPKKLPELGRSLGLGIGNFKRSLQEAQDEVRAAMKTAPDQGATLKPAAPAEQQPELAQCQQQPQPGHEAGGTCCGGAHKPTG